MPKVISKKRRKELRENRLLWTPNDYEHALNTLDIYEKAIEEALNCMSSSYEEKGSEMLNLQKAIHALTAISE